MNEHCKGCRYHHNAGHPKTNPLARIHNDWCCKNSKKASEAVGHCVLQKQKESL